MPQQSDEFIPILQGRVFHKVGRCLLHLQQYEQRMKTLLTNRELAGNTTADFERSLARRRAKFGTQTLGQLLAELTGTHLQSEQKDPQDQHAETGSDEPMFSIKFNRLMDEERYQKTCKNLKELLALRNDLVHHFIERFDLLTAESCLAALAYLDDALQKIADHRQELYNWLKNYAAAREAVVALLNSPDFQIFEELGYFPDRPVNWPGTTIIQGLMHAERECQHNGWVDLKQAIQVMGSLNPKITPSRYGCRNWRQVLRVSGLFEIRREKAADHNETLTFFRSRT